MLGLIFNTLVLGSARMTHPLEPKKGQRSHENQFASGCHATAVFVVIQCQGLMSETVRTFNGTIK